MRRSKTSIAAVLVAFMLVSCVLAVSPETYGEHCRFAEESSRCGQCLRDRCEPTIDACCGDASCGAMSDVDRCARGETDACEALAAREDSSEPRERDLGFCMKARCRAVCRTFVGTSTTECSEIDSARGTACTCKQAQGSAANNFDCSPSSFANTVCCAPSTWPDEGQECTCRPLGCVSIAEGCFCRLVSMPPEFSSCKTEKCCQVEDDDLCTCRTRCFDIEQEVTRCAIRPIESGSGCERGQKRVASCSSRN